MSIGKYFAIEKAPRKGFRPLEWSVLVYTVLTAAHRAVLFDEGRDNPML